MCRKQGNIGSGLGLLVLMLATCFGAIIGAATYLLTGGA